VITYNADLPWQEFIRLEIQTKHLDPMYPALNSVGWSEAKLMRWCAAMVTYYNAGVACKLCDYQGDDFWHGLWDHYDTVKRPAERRHFRGDLGRKAIRFWRNEFATPEKFIQTCMKSTFMKALKSGVPQIGPYFTWKVCDYRESVFGYDLDWNGAENYLTKLALKGLDEVFKEGSYAEKLQIVIDEIAQYKDPARNIRQCGIAEAETAACSFRYYYGHQTPIGHDIVNKRRSLEGCGENAEQLAAAIPKEPFDSDILKETAQ
jgi:hypothetical protein